MDKNVQATRTAIAQNRLSDAATALAERYGLSDHAAALNLGNVPAAVRPLYQLEATADLLDALVASGGATDAEATPASELAALDTITPGLADKLVAAGFTTVVDVRNASDDDLKAIKGVATATIRKMRAEIGQPDDDDPELDEPLDDAEGMEAEPE